MLNDYGFGYPISKLGEEQSSNLSSGNITESGVTIHQGYAIGPRGAKYVEAGFTSNGETVYKNNRSYYKLVDGKLENIKATEVIKKEYFPPIKVQKNNGSNPSAGKDYYVSKKGTFKVMKYLEPGQTIEDYDKKYLVESARANGINVGRSKEHTNTTLGHWEKSIDIAEKALEDSNVKAVYVDEALRNISAKFKDDETRPDVTIVYNDGTFELIEVQSETDTDLKLTNKLKKIEKDYGIVACPDRNNFEKIGEMIYWAFNESDDKVIEISPNMNLKSNFIIVIRIEK